MSSHLVFIASAYGVALLGLGGLAAWLLADYARQSRLLAELEARGTGRRQTGGVGGGEA